MIRRDTPDEIRQLEHDAADLADRDPDADWQWCNVCREVAVDVSEGGPTCPDCLRREVAAGQPEMDRWYGYLAAVRADETVRALAEVAIWQGDPQARLLLGDRIEEVSGAQGDAKGALVVVLMNDMLPF